MKKYLLTLLAALILSSCAEQRYYQACLIMYRYEIYDDINYKINFTNYISTTDCGITFINQNGDTITIAHGQYKYETLNH